MSGAALKDLGMQAAVDHAERVVPRWKDLALLAFTKYAMTHAMFTTEQVRLASTEVPSPPDKRAWGAVARQATRDRIVERQGFVQAKSPTVHCMYVTLYQSLLYREAA